MPGSTHLNNAKGFTLIEVITILVILGILSVFAASKMSINNTDLLTTQSALKSHIRYAQSKAMQSADTIWGIRFDSSQDEYWLFQCDVAASCQWTTNRVLPPGSESSDANVNNDRVKTSRINIDINPVSVGGSTKSQFTLTYDHMGIPFWAEGSAITFSNPLEDSTGIHRLTDNITIQLSDTAGSSKQIQVASETGFVQ